MSRIGHRAGRALAVVLLSWLPVACGPGAETGDLTLVVERPDTLTGTVDHLQLTWLTARRAVLFERRVPDDGPLPSPAANVVATVLLTIDREDPAPERRAVVVARGADGAIVGAAWTRLATTPTPRELRLTLAAGPIPDADGDRIPDAVDDCPGVDDAAQCMPPDGGVTDAGAPTDGGGAGADAAPPETDGDAAGAGREDARGPEAGAADAAPADAAAPDARAPDVRAPDATPQPPAPPSDPAAILQPPYAVQVRWQDRSVDESAFRIERAATATGPFAAVGTTPADATSFLDSKVPPGTHFYRVRATAAAGDSAASPVVSATVVADPAERKLAGTPFGSERWGPGREFDKAFDGNTTTFFDAKDADTGYVGIDAGKPVTIARLRFHPRIEEAGRMKGGRLQGSNTSPTEGFVDLYTITVAPPVAWTDVILGETRSFRYLRYVGPARGFTNVAELELYTTTPP